MGHNGKDNRTIAKGVEMRVGNRTPRQVETLGYSKAERLRKETVHKGRKGRRHHVRDNRTLRQREKDMLVER